MVLPEPSGLSWPSRLAGGWKDGTAHRQEDDDRGAVAEAWLETGGRRALGFRLCGICVSRRRDMNTLQRKNCRKRLVSCRRIRHDRDPMVRDRADGTFYRGALRREALPDSK